MSAVKSSLIDDYKRLENMASIYKRRIAELPKGSVHIKHIGGNDYCYLFFREGNKVVSKYIGGAGGDEASRLSSLISQRKQYASQLKRVDCELRDLKIAIMALGGFEDK